MFHKTIFQKAARYIIKSFKNKSANSDHWGLTKNIEQQGYIINEQINKNQYYLPPSRVYYLNNTRVNVWPALASIVIKSLSLLIDTKIIQQLNWQNVYSVKNQGGTKKCIRDVYTDLPNYKFVIKTDIADYYKTIKQEIVQEQLKQYTDDERLLNLIEQYCNRVEIDNGVYKHVTQGIAKGGALSPQLGNLYLRPLDKVMRKNTKVKYYRYMDDILILCKTRHHLKQALKQIYNEIKKLGLTLSKPKTYIGKIDKGFNFLGYHFSGQPNADLQVAQSTVVRMLEKVRQLYEQHADETRVQDYLLRWRRWVNSGLAGVNVDGLQTKIGAGSITRPILY